MKTLSEIKETLAIARMDFDKAAATVFHRDSGPDLLPGNYGEQVLLRQRQIFSRVAREALDSAELLLSRLEALIDIQDTEEK